MKGRKTRDNKFKNSKRKVGIAGIKEIVKKGEEENNGQLKTQNWQTDRPKKIWNWHILKNCLIYLMITSNFLSSSTSFKGGRKLEHHVLFLLLLLAKYYDCDHNHSSQPGSRRGVYVVLQRPRRSTLPTRLFRYWSVWWHTLEESVASSGSTKT